VLIVYNTTSRASFLWADEWLKDIRAHSDLNLLIANKADSVPKEEESASTCSTKANTLWWLSALETDRKQLAYTIGIGKFHRCMKTIIDMANGDMTGVGAERRT